MSWSRLVCAAAAGLLCLGLSACTKNEPEPKAAKANVDPRLKDLQDAHANPTGSGFGKKGN